MGYCAVMIIRPGWSLAAVLIATGLSASCGGNEASDTDPPVRTTVPTTLEVTTIAPATSPPTTVAPVAASTMPPPRAQGASSRLPNVVGLDLQLAQDTLQAAGFYALSSHDATGQNRNQVVDRNWQVCDQTPPGGTMATPDTAVDLGAVKDEETCP